MSQVYPIGSGKPKIEIQSCWRPDVGKSGGQVNIVVHFGVVESKQRQGYMKWFLRAVVKVRADPFRREGWKTKELSLRNWSEGVELGESVIANWDGSGVVEVHDAEPGTAAKRPADPTAVAADHRLLGAVTECSDAAKWDNAKDTLRVVTNQEGRRKPRYDGLFSDEELDALERNLGGTVPGDSAVSPEPDEYDKELEDRLYPLDEVALTMRVKQNTEAVNEPSLADMAKLLDLPLETLRRTQEASPAGNSSPEFWEEWYQDTLESSAETKGVNCDFKSLFRAAFP
ncbi:hypothetical protein PR001_g14574 [Phytophthora rubi]|uniref:Uncharacterized protein n=1 Tax=Phytophthora rubi TaxID=129364 RepID=A0A6A3LCH0_9STRA|nr:hypothetical protein PR001_g14574 [Phytophthora rubi]